MGLDERHQSNKTTKSLLAASLLYCSRTGHQAQAAQAAQAALAAQAAQAALPGLAALARLAATG